LVKDFLNRPLTRIDLGNEIGSLNYIKDSPFFFIRTKALQPNSFIPVLTKESVIPIMPRSFIDKRLHEGDLLISKDSNIGEIVMLDKHYSNYMMSGAIYKLPIEKYKLYLLAFIKHQMFREQLNSMVPKGATLKHAKTIFLDCLIPMPKLNTEKTINYIEILTQSIINKEKLINSKYKIINDLIDLELENSINTEKYYYNYPSFKEIQASGRLDTGVYLNKFKKIDFKIKNYKHGHFFLNKNSLKSGNTPIIRHIGNINDLNYRWVTPTHCSEYGFISLDEGINLKGVNNIYQDCILLTNRGTGVDCGKATFYNFSDYGKGHHNQGMYRYSDDDKNRMLFILCFLNTKIMRNYCSHLSVGSKMNELKLDHILQIPIPDFPQNILNNIITIFHNSSLKYNLNDCTLDNFLDKDNEYNQQAGIYELAKTAKYLKNKLNKAIDDIINDKEVEINFYGNS
jgi:type I restriction enzyme S subunit